MYLRLPETQIELSETDLRIPDFLRKSEKSQINLRDISKNRLHPVNLSIRSFGRDLVSSYFAHIPLRKSLASGTFLAQII